MKLTKAEFFEQATGQLLSTLKLQEGLGNLRNYMRRVMPLRTIRLLGYPVRAQGASKVLILRADLREDITFLARKPQQQDALRCLLQANREHGELITERSHPLACWYHDLISPERTISPLPWYVLALWDGNHFMGECRFSGDPNQLFSESDCLLMDSLRPVLCIALNNYQQYIQIKEDRDAALTENNRLKEALADDASTSGIIGAQGGMHLVMERVRMVALHDVPVLITGETGTGKELIARELHLQSSRKSRPFIAVNCGAIPSSLSDSELFGHVKGSFTGAIRDHKGYFERANGGTLFLDEIGELPLETQVRLLRVLQECVVLPIGGSAPVPVDTRIITATNRDLQHMMQEMTFRKDLYYRLRVAHILLPPLRERPDDIPALIKHILHKITVPSGLPPPTLAPGELVRMQRYSWPGNVRELENVIMEAIVCTPPGKQLYLHLESALREPQVLASDGCTTFANEALRSDAVLANHYRCVLHKCHGRIKGEDGAAALLGLHPSTLRFRLKKLGILSSTDKAEVQIVKRRIKPNFVH